MDRLLTVATAVTVFVVVVAALAIVAIFTQGGYVQGLAALGVVVACVWVAWTVADIRQDTYPN